MPPEKSGGDAPADDARGKNWPEVGFLTVCAHRIVLPKSLPNVVREARVCLVSEYVETLRLNPRHFLSHMNLGVMLVRQDRLDDAIHQFEITLSLEPNSAAAKDYLLQVAAHRNGLGR